MATTMPAKRNTLPPAARNLLLVFYWVALLALLWLLFRQSFLNWYKLVTWPNSYYSHATLVPFVSLFFVWRKRRELAVLPRKSSAWGYPVLALSCALVLGADLLGFRIFGQLAFIPLVIGMMLVFLGLQYVKRLWFPLAFLLFMIPLPQSLTTSVTFRVKMLASEGAVRLANLFFLPMVRDGSYIHFGNDQLLVGDVCSGLRSLIALLALGAIVSYLSESRAWARILILVASAPIAVLSNILRILLLCVVGHFWGSEVASGRVHDISGFLIYVVALVMLFGVERLLHRVAPARKQPEEEEA